MPGSKKYSEFYKRINKSMMKNQFPESDYLPFAWLGTNYLTFFASISPYLNGNGSNYLIVLLRIKLYYLHTVGTQ